MTDFDDLKSWVLANAQQSRRPEVGDEIIAALGELADVRADLVNAGVLLRQKDVEIERLRAALVDMLDGSNWSKDRHDEMYWCGTTATYDNARKMIRGEDGI